MEKYFVYWLNLDTNERTLILTTDDKVLAFRYGRRYQPRNVELIIEENGKEITREIGK